MRSPRSSLVTGWFSAVFGLFVSVVAGAFPSTPKQRMGEWSLRLGTLGPTVAWGGHRVVTGGYVRLYRPHYHGSLLHSFKARRPASTASTAEGVSTVRWQARNREYRMDYEVRLTPPKLNITLDVQVDPKAALGGIEFAAAFLPAELIAGARGRALVAGKWRDFTVPRKPTTNWNLQGKHAAQAVELVTAAGKFTITDPNGEHLRLSDMRLNQNYRTTAPCFWIFPTVNVPPDRHIQAAVEIVFEPSPGLVPLSRLSTPAFPADQSPRTLRPPTATQRIFPHPQRFVGKAGSVRLNGPVEILVSGDVEACRSSAELLKADIIRLFGGTAKVILDAPAEKRARIRLKIVSQGLPALRPEGFRLDVDPNGVSVLAKNARGLYYGSQALLQLLSTSGSGVLTAPCCQIEDWPGLSRRVVHPPRLWPGSNLAYFRRYFDILARARYNLVVWEISGSVRFPEIPWAWKEDGSFEPAPVKAVIAEARSRGIEMIPELECLGHAHEWLGGDPGDFERFPWLKACFENPKTRTDLCPSNPKTAEAVRRTMDAISALFDHPRLFHIGLDESWRFATCPTCSKRDATTLLANWLNMLHDHLAGRHQGMMMWHDMLLAKKRFKGAVANGDRTEGAIDRLSRDVVVCNWQYHPGPALETTRYFQGKGFPVLICPWYDPADVFDCAKAAHILHAGLFSTNWNAFKARNPMPSFAAAAGRDMLGSLLAAEYAWNSPKKRDSVLEGIVPARDLAEDEYRSVGNVRFIVPDFRRLPPVPRLVLPKNARLDAGGVLVVGGIPFLPARLEARANADAAAREEPARGIRGVPFGKTVSDIFLLVGLDRKTAAPDTEFTLRFHWKDAPDEDVFLDQSVVEFSRFTTVIGLAFRGRFGGFPCAGRYVLLRVRNPQPDKLVVSLDLFQSDGEPSGLAVAGIAARLRAPASGR